FVYITSARRHAAIDGRGELCVGLCSENSVIAGGGVDQRDFFGGQGEALLGAAQVVHVHGEEDELGRSSGRVLCREGQRQQAELHPTVYRREDALTILKIEQTDKGLAINQVTEEELVK